MGQLVAIHTATAFSAWNVANPQQLFHPSIFGDSSTTYTEWAPGSGGQPTSQATDTFDGIDSGLNLARPDGFGFNDSTVNPLKNAWSAVGELTFQGVRAYDDTTSQWASPDFYSGDVHDPASQRPFMWNGNNPLEYRDPSGYDPEDDKEVERDEWAHVWEPTLENDQRNAAAPYWTGRRAAVDEHMKHTLYGKFEGMNAIDYTDAALELRMRGVNNEPGSGVEVFDKSNGEYAVYDSATGDVGVYGADGKITTFYNLRDGGYSKSEAAAYAKNEGKSIRSVPCTQTHLKIR